MVSLMVDGQNMHPVKYFCDESFLIYWMFLKNLLKDPKMKTAKKANFCWLEDANVFFFQFRVNKIKEEILNPEKQMF